MRNFMTTAPSEAELREWFSFRPFVRGETFPFFESENCDIYGYGHQNKAEFAEAVNRYDLSCGADTDEFPWNASNITHRWAVMWVNLESFSFADNGLPFTEDTPGAFPITCLWGQR